MYGILSLIAWSLILVVSVKYLMLILRLGNRGEGGIMALLALILSIRRRRLFVSLDCVVELVARLEFWRTSRTHGHVFRIPGHPPGSILRS